MEGGKSGGNILVSCIWFIVARRFSRLRFLQQVPGFAVSLVECASSLRFRSRAEPGMKTNGDTFKRFYRNHVPRLTWRDVCGYEINFFQRICKAAPVHPMASQNRESGLTAIASAVAGFHLHPRQAPAVLDEKVVGMAVAVRSRDPNAFACCPVHERKFGELTHTFGAEVSRRQVVFLFFQVGYPVVVIGGWWTEQLRDEGSGRVRPCIS